MRIVLKIVLYIRLNNLCSKALSALGQMSTQTTFVREKSFVCSRRQLAYT